MCCSVYWRLWSFRNLLEVPKVMRSLLLCLLEMLEVLEVPKVMRCVLLCMLDAVPKVVEVVLKVVEDVPKVAEVVLKVLGGCADGDEGCAEGAWGLYRRWTRSRR